MEYLVPVWWEFAANANAIDLNLISAAWLSALFGFPGLLALFFLNFSGLLAYSGKPPGKTRIVFGFFIVLFSSNLIIDYAFFKRSADYNAIKCYSYDFLSATYLDASGLRLSKEDREKRAVQCESAFTSTHDLEKRANLAAKIAGLYGKFHPSAMQKWASISSELGNLQGDYIRSLYYIYYAPIKVSPRYTSGFDGFSLARQLLDSELETPDLFKSFNINFEDGSDFDYPRRLLNRAFEKGFARAGTELGHYYRTRPYIADNTDIGGEYILQAAARGDIWAANYHGYLLSNDEANQESREPAGVDFYKSAADRSDETALTNLLITKLRAASDINEANKYLLELKELVWDRNGRAAFLVGKELLFGDVGLRDPGTGLKFLKRAADLGYAFADLEIFDLYTKSYETIENLPHKESGLDQSDLLRHLFRAYQYGAANASDRLCYLVAMTRENRYAPFDYKASIWPRIRLSDVTDTDIHAEYASLLDGFEGVCWKALYQGSSNAAVNLGLAYYHGDVVEKNLSLSMMLSAYAATLGNMYGFQNLAYTLREQAVTSGEQDVVLNLYAKALDLGRFETGAYLGDIASRGVVDHVIFNDVSIEERDCKAIDWYTRWAEGYRKSRKDLDESSDRQRGWWDNELSRYLVLVEKENPGYIAARSSERLKYFVALEDMLSTVGLSEIETTIDPFPILAEGKVLVQSSTVPTSLENQPPPISLRFAAKHDCSTPFHLIITGSDERIITSRGSITRAIKFVWNPNRRHIEELNFTVSFEDGELGGFEVSIEAMVNDASSTSVSVSVVPDMESWVNFYGFRIGKSSRMSGKVTLVGSENFQPLRWLVETYLIDDFDELKESINKIVPYVAGFSVNFSNVSYAGQFDEIVVEVDDPIISGEIEMSDSLFVWRGDILGVTKLSRSGLSLITDQWSARGRVGYTDFREFAGPTLDRRFDFRLTSIRRGSAVERRTEVTSANPSDAYVSAVREGYFPFVYETGLNIDAVCVLPELLRMIDEGSVSNPVISSSRSHVPGQYEPGVTSFQLFGKNFSPSDADKAIATCRSRYGFFAD